MTVLAWDGKTLAADKRGSNFGLAFSVSKLHAIGDYLVGVSGNFSRAGAYLDWFKHGRDPLTYPKQEPNDDAYLLAIHRSGRIERYESTGYPVVVEEKLFAGGSGRDFALAALHCDKTAVEAVEIACRLSTDCGNGIDTLTFGEV